MFWSSAAQLSLEWVDNSFSNFVHLCVSFLVVYSDLLSSDYVERHLSGKGKTVVTNVSIWFSSWFSPPYGNTAVPCGSWKTELLTDHNPASFAHCVSAWFVEIFRTLFALTSLLLVIPGQNMSVSEPKKIKTSHRMVRISKWWTYLWASN